jgi:regulatory protein
MYKEQLTKEQALPKVRQYCAYQERCHSEVKEKLYSFGLYKKDVELLLSNLIEDNYLNEERFAMIFAGGRFRIKHWGKIKIRYELKQKQVSDYCIKKALQEINSTEYLKTLYKLAESKLKLLKPEKNVFTKKKKLHDYLVQKGFESPLIQNVMKDLL